jgi:hypothetical protein
LLVGLREKNNNTTFVELGKKESFSGIATEICSLHRVAVFSNKR